MLFSYCSQSSNLNPNSHPSSAVSIIQPKNSELLFQSWNCGSNQIINWLIARDLFVLFSCEVILAEIVTVSLFRSKVHSCWFKKWLSPLVSISLWGNLLIGLSSSQWGRIELQSKKSEAWKKGSIFPCIAFTEENEADPLTEKLIEYRWVRRGDDGA